MEEKKITINGIEYQMKPGLKAIMIFEKITDKAFELKRDTDVISYIYACILCGTPDSMLGFEEMLDAFDADPSLFARACDIAMARTSMDKIVALSEDGGTEPKKE